MSRADANLKFAIENLVDGAFFNSGQCCCGIERIYVHESRYDAFVKGFVDLTSQYVLGDPLDQATTLGPMARANLAEVVRRADAGGDRQRRESPYRSQVLRLAIGPALRTSRRRSSPRSITP